jgi:hypothetical protein
MLRFAQHDIKRRAQNDTHIVILNEVKDLSVNCSGLEC